MKKIILVVIALLFSSTAYGQVLTLNSPETLAVPTATKLDLRTVAINVTDQNITVTYRFIDADNQPIPVKGSNALDRTWRCQERAEQLAADCTAEHTPYWGCTGVGTGEEDERARAGG